MVADGDQLEADAQILGQIARIGDAVLGGIRAGHADAGDVFLADRIHRDGRGERRIDAAAEPDEHALEAALANVIARAQDQRLIDGFAFVGKFSWRSPVSVSVSTSTRSSSNDAAEAITSPSRIHGEAGAIENQLIVAAHLVDIDDGHAETAAPWRRKFRAAARACPCDRARR